ncbi:MAG: RNA pyrophosphohydrolase [Alphaproteobacteria bacterium]
MPYRLGVGMMLLNRQGKVFVGERVDTAGAWQMPQGGLGPGEDPKAAALRELAEEIGTDKVEILAESRGWLAYDLPPALMGRVWGGRYRGQRQKWFALRFTGTDGDIRIDGGHREFDAWRWEKPERLPDLIVPFKRAVYEAVLREFRPLLPSPR